MITGFLEILRGVWTWLGNIMRAIGKWLREPHDWWRIGCFSAAMVCVFMAVKWRDAEQREKEALDQVVSVTITYKAKLKSATDTCEANRLTANTQALTVQAALEAKNRNLEQQLSVAMAQIETNRIKERDRAKKSGDAVAAGIRSGDVQLQDWWRGQAGGDGASGNGAMPGASTATAVDDDAAELRATGAGDLVEIAAKCDADIRAYQETLKAEREIK